MTTTATHLHPALAKINATCPAYYAACAAEYVAADRSIKPLTDRVTALTTERDALLRRRFVTGSIPAGPTTDDTEFVFVDGRAFVAAVKHEETVGQIAEERDEAIRDLATARGQCEATADLLRDAIRERDAAYAELTFVTDSRDHWRRLAEAGAEGEAAAIARVDTLLEAIADHRTRLTKLGGLDIPTDNTLYAVANEVAKRTGYAGDPDNGATRLRTWLDRIDSSGGQDGK